MNAAIDPFERLRGLLAFVQIHVIILSLEIDLNGRTSTSRQREEELSPAGARELIAKLALDVTQSPPKHARLEQESLVVHAYRTSQNMSASWVSMASLQP